ncbi:MAG: DNA damage-inducible protein D [Burkholderiales bacterium]|nr:DNA damage-inducible protein D [Burkholderiales bacterium]
MSNNISNLAHDTFESTKQVDDYGNEFWYARGLAKILDYAEYRNFMPVIGKAKIACEKSGYTVGDHFVEAHEEIIHGKGATKTYDSYALSRYACYLIVQNADASKPVIANGQTYFAIQTRHQELQEQDSFNQLKEDHKRLFLRNELKEHNKQLVETAQLAGVETNLDFAIFQNHGYKGLYGGLDAKAIHKQKGLKKSQKILDHMNSTELAANLFRATQAEEKLKRDEVKNKTRANQTHYEVGKKVRETIKELGGTMPEDLPSVENIQKMEQKTRLEQDKLTILPTKKLLNNKNNAGNKDD